ncbi:hypothetical protein LPB86_17205 [Pedobacter sp. MC2016-14]|uniref:hypothetical protein n=1 Tax=Pedobacter sp. MC2016-14 TaxID=2897327 RepID=UPI001E4D91A7|nr:hypothetical protein [Pedobacter sp. MC2016-14]MCD0489983.1 hypothetical protein [Pedobacter sp. MC2016-14]
MNTPENENEQEENKKIVYKETTLDDDETLSSGETSSSTGSGRSAFAHTPERKNRPLGTGHEPGVTPGRDF